MKLDENKTEVAQAQSQGPSRGCGDGLVRKFAIDVADFLRYAGYSAAIGSPADRLLRQAREIVQQADTPPERSQARTSHPRFRHRRTGDIYELLLIANEHAERTAQYPPTAVYQRLSDRTVWSRPVQDWGKDFEEVVGE